MDGDDEWVWVGIRSGRSCELQLPAICQDACQRLMLHPYITASRTIINIVLSYIQLIQALDTKRLVASLVKGGLLGICHPFYPSSVVLFQLHGVMVSHMQVLAHSYIKLYTWILTSLTGILT